MNKTANPMREARAALALHPCCGAHCRTTGGPCKAPAMANGRCRMHGGKSTGRPQTTGRYTKKRHDDLELMRFMLAVQRKIEGVTSRFFRFGATPENVERLTAELIARKRPK